MRFEYKATPVGVDERVALAAVDLLSGVVTAWSAGLVGALWLSRIAAVGAGVAPDPFAICHHERVVYPLKAPVVAPGANQR